MVAKPEIRGSELVALARRYLKISFDTVAGFLASCMNEVQPLCWSTHGYPTMRRRAGVSSVRGVVWSPRPLLKFRLNLVERDLVSLRVASGRSYMVLSSLLWFFGHGSSAFQNLHAPAPLHFLRCEFVCLKTLPKSFFHEHKQT